MNTIADIKQAVVDILEVLPLAKQQELLNFAEFLHSRNSIKPLRHGSPPQDRGIAVTSPRKSLEGLWADLDINITEEDIAEARSEMWGNFPKDIDL